MMRLGWSCLACGVAVAGCGSGDAGDDAANTGMTPETGGSGSGGEEGVGGDGGSTGGAQNGTGGGTSGSGSGGDNGSSGGNSSSGGSSGGPLPPELVWRQEGPPIFGEGIWGSGPNDIYAVGRSGDLIHSTGDGNWLFQTTDTGANLTGISASGPSDIYVSVNSNMILHSTGDGMWEKQIQNPGSTFSDIWVGSASDIYAIGPGALFGTGGGSWVVPPQQVTTDATILRAIWGASTDDIYVLAANGKVHHSNGDGNWSPQVVQPVDQATLEDIDGVEGGRIYTVGAKAVFSSSGNGVWTPEVVDIPESSNARAVWAASPNAVFLCTTQGEVFRSNGAGAWSSAQQLDEASTPWCEAIWGTGPDNVYLATGDGVYHGTPE